MWEITSEKEQEVTKEGTELNERQKEELHLEYCINIIKNNIEEYSSKYQELSSETKELYDNYRSDNPELHNDLVIGLDMKSMMFRTMNKNSMALSKPYFARIDYTELEDDKQYCLYIGKHGIRKSATEGLIVDWRAPISSVYYDSDIGISSYMTPFGEEIDIELKLKRTYEIVDGRLIDFYDSDVIANDEFLTKYLSKNKEVVLGEIIATIQKEQNEIIRDSPWHSVIVQGVAGSGKTTVAMHRISYILYNYKDKFRPDEFFILGSNKMLLNYITGVLPNLDVYNVNQMTLQEFLLHLLDKDFAYKKGKYTLVNSFMKKERARHSEVASKLKRFKGSIDFIKALQEYLTQYEIDSVIRGRTETEGKNNHPYLYTKDELLYFLNFFQDKPMQEKIDILNKRLVYKITSYLEEEGKQKEEIRSEVNRYKNYYGNRQSKINLLEVYVAFLRNQLEERGRYLDMGLQIPENEILQRLLQEVENKNIDIYDLGMLTYIKKRLLWKKDFEYVSHIVIDEAQDFGVMIFQIFRQLFPTCTYTIMGDVTQNINYDSGMNDWETLVQEVFRPDKDRFYTLAKSYRNTVEISEYASRVLQKATFKTYNIEPIIRHGKEVTVIKTPDEEGMIRETVAIVRRTREAGYDTIAIICRSLEETLRVKDTLAPYIALEHLEEDMEEMTFRSGVMVLPIYMTKGLEFDAVILWNPDEESYQVTDEDAKLLYVAITRALHELYLVYQGNLSGLLT